MSPILIDPPSGEPVSLAEAKLYLRVDGSDEDQLIAALITAARLLIEAASGRFMLDQRWRIVLDRWPGARRLGLPLAPVRAVVAVRVAGEGASVVTLPEGAVLLDPGAEPEALRIDAAVPQPARAPGGIEIDLAVGFGASPVEVPATLRQAILIMVARWFERRGDDVDGPDARLPASVLALLAPFRRVRL